LCIFSRVSREPVRPDRRPLADQRTDPLTAECAWDVPGDHQVENPDGRLLSLQKVMAVRSMTRRSRLITSMKEISS